MTAAQRAAHERLTAMLPVRTVGDMDDPANWPERDRELSPAELEYLPCRPQSRPLTIHPFTHSGVPA